MSRNFLLPFMVALICAYVSADSDEPQPRFLQTQRALINGHRYFTDPEDIQRPWHQAREFCEAHGGQLAKVVNPVIYHQLRVSVPFIGDYWIDGIDRATTDRFELDNRCTPDTNTFSLGRVPLALSRTSCLALTRASSRLFSRIQSIDCSHQKRVICSIPENGCGEEDYPDGEIPEESPAPVQNPGYVGSGSNGSEAEPETLT